MATRVLLASQVQSRTSATHVTGIAGAAMLFLFEGAFTIGIQATTRVCLVEVRLQSFNIQDQSSQPSQNGCVTRSLIDLLGIVIVTVGTFIPGVHCVFTCEPGLRKLHWAVVSHSERPLSLPSPQPSPEPTIC